MPVSKLPISLASVLVITAMLNSQTAPAADVRVEVSTDKKLYKRGEPIKFRAILINQGKSPVYVSKSFYYQDSDVKGAQTPGFELRIRQISGPGLRLPGCAWAGDYISPRDLRSAEEIFKEDFLKLLPGGLVGFEDDLSKFPPIGLLAALPDHRKIPTRCRLLVERQR